MACYHPVTAFRENGPGTRPVFFDEPQRDKTDYGYTPIELPCGKCIGCTLRYARDWTTRIMHEASLHNENAFITLTYETKKLPPGELLRHRDWQLFMKKLRDKYAPKKIGYYVAGEYGPQGGRPHYHAILFNHNFADRTKIRVLDQSDNQLYRSSELDKLWRNGFASIGLVTPQSAAYVARYCLKKVNTAPSERNKTSDDQVDTKEYSRMSTRPAIGLRWLRQYASDVYPNDTVIIDGKENKPPRYYDRKFKEWRPAAFDELALRRAELAAERESDSTPERLAVREEVALKNAFRKRNALR